MVHEGVTCLASIAGGRTRRPAVREMPLMANRVMRGSRLGSVSYETNRNDNLAARQIARYRTADGGEFDIPSRTTPRSPIPGTAATAWRAGSSRVVSSSNPRRRSRSRARIGTCCGNAVRSRNLKSCWRSASRSSSQSEADSQSHRLWLVPLAASAGMRYNAARLTPRYLAMSLSVCPSAFIRTAVAMRSVSLTLRGGTTDPHPSRLQPLGPSPAAL